jgi:uronate dehydrogenase
VTVLLTGSSGRVGSMLRTRLPALGWSVRCYDRTPSGDTEQSVDGEVTADLNDVAALDAAMADVSAVVHLAGHPTEAPWSQIRDANIEGTFQVFEAARRAGVRRVLYASSDHAVGFARRPADGSELDAATAVRPDTLYGVSKAFGEALGRYYVDRYGMQVACLRIGTCADEPPDLRSLATWLSPDDCARLVDACLHSERLTYSVIWGVSANRHRWWSLAAGLELDYKPADDASLLRPDWSAEPRGNADDLVGGGFIDPSLGIDEVAARYHDAAS